MPDVFSRQRRDPYPWGRPHEIALVVLGGLLICAALAAAAGVGAAGALFGRGWVWPPDNDHLVRTLGGLLGGHPGQGLPPELAAKLPGPRTVYGCVALAETLLVAALVAAVIGVVRYRRPNDARSGIATRTEAEQVLGVSRLRSGRSVIRPDLYPRKDARRDSR